MKTKIQKNYARILPEEVIDISNSKNLKEKVDELIEKDIANIVLDFKNVKEIDSSGIRDILLSHKIINTNNTNGELIIENVKSKYVQKVFNMFELNKIVKM